MLPLEERPERASESERGSTGKSFLPFLVPCGLDAACLLQFCDPRANLVWKSLTDTPRSSDWSVLEVSLNSQVDPQFHHPLGAGCVATCGG